jgi:glycosyltransferase involved in cell wall biosynthesis
MAWEVFRLVREDHLNSDRYWAPSSPQGGTELMMNQLSIALGTDADRINLQVGSPQGLSIHHTRTAEDDPRPRVVWIHNDYLNPQYEWMRDEEQMAKVVRLVFVSKTQRQHFLDNYDLPPERCVVIPNAIHTNKTVRPWPRNPWRWRCAYISAAFRGLDLLLDAWQEIAPENADLHIWSGPSLWALDDNSYRPNYYRPLFAKANSIPNVFYHRIAPNDFIRTALLDMHFHLYPCTIPSCETFCLSAVEAMSAGCRVIAPSASVFPETTAGFARLYPYSEDRDQHKRDFMLAVEDEFARPWHGRPELAEAQQAYCQAEFDWSRRVREWQYLIDEVSPA